MQWNWTHTLRTLALLGVAIALAAPPAAAQTPEGTVITNTAVVNYQDANSRAYTPVSAQVSITVGFKAGLNTVAGAATVTPASPSTNQTMTFTISNIGNGTDQVQVSQNNSNPAVITTLRYQINGAGPTYNTLADLNTALAALDITGITGSVTISVIYNVPDGQGGAFTDYTLTATSVRDPLVSDGDVTRVSPPAAYSVAVSPDSSSPRAERLPANGYAFTFYVKNTGNITENFTLATSVSGAVITVVGFNPASPVSIASGDSVAVTVDYNIAEVAVGSLDRLTLTATSVTSPAATDDGFLDMIVVRPTITIAKAVFAPDSLTALAGTVKPGDVIWYRVLVTNAGDRDASAVVVTDSLPEELTFGLLAPDNGSDWTLSYSGGLGGTVSASLGVALAPAVSRHFWIRATVR